MEPNLPEETVSGADQYSVQAQPLPTPAPGTPSSTTGGHEAGHLALTTLEQAMAAYVQEMRASGRSSQNPAVASDLAFSLAALSVEAVPSHGRVLPYRSIPADLVDRPVTSRRRLVPGRLEPSTRLRPTRVRRVPSATGWFGRGMCQKRLFRKTRCLKLCGACPKRWSQRHLFACCEPVSSQAHPEG